MEKTLASLQQILKKPISSFVALTDGISNENYLVNDEYVVRIKNNVCDPFYNAQTERKIEQILKDNNFSNETILIDENGNKISKLLKNFRYINTTSLTDVKSVALTLKKLHSVKISIPLFDTFKRIEYYKSQINQLNHLNADLEKTIINAIKKYPLELADVCHNDIVKGNMLFSNDNLYLIDYEYAGKNDIYFDLASFISENDIDDNFIINEFLSTYFASNKYNYKKFIAYCHLLNLLWYYWAMHNYRLQKKAIYKQIADSKFNSLKLL